ncbi:MAG TPA: DUF2723 domain-containing protein [Kiritimatiellia bacterium]|nr:DUF2723 domain-containing protein [Kiritimatiellia bacterium]
MTGARFFGAYEWKSAGIAAFLAFVVFRATLAPTVTLEYSGALVVAADHLGIARPPGYPVWTLLAKGFICLFPHAQYHGHPNPAWAVNWMSAFFGALACGLLAATTCRLARAAAASGAACAVSGIAAGLLFAASPVLWSQAVIAETHALTTFYFLGLLALSLRWIDAADRRSPYLLAFLAGLGLAVSPLLILFLPVLLLAAALTSPKDFARMTAAALLFGGFLFAEFTWGSRRPATGAAGLGIALALAGVLAVFRPTRPVAGLFLLLLAGLVPYVYLPLASDRNPPMNMGYARTWEGFWHVVSRGQYEAMVPLDPFAHPGIFFRDLAWYARLVAAQFTAPLAALALVPVAALRRRDRRAQAAFLLVFVALFCFAVVAIVGANPQVDVQNTWVARTLFLPSFALVALLIGAGWAILWNWIARRRTLPQP